MIARVVTKRDDSRLAYATTLASALGLTGVVLDDLLNGNLFRPPDVSVYGLVALLIVLAGVGPWLAWTRRGRAMKVKCEAGVVHAGDLSIRAGDVTALHVASGARGCSVAVTRGSNVVFLEVERADEARRIAEAVRVPVTPFGELGARPASRSFAAVQALVSVLAIAFGPLYFAAAVGGYDPGLGVSAKALFGVGGFLASWAAVALVVTRRLVPAQAMAIGRSGTWDAHVALHRRHAADAEVDAVRTEEDKRAQAAEREEEQARAQPIRVANLGRGDEQVGAWLARLDAIPNESHAYRGDAMKKDVLWETLGDDSAPVDSRMAAARVLRRRYGEEERALVRVVDDHDVRVRVEAALEEHDEAEEHIERLGPLFRAR